MTATSTPHPGLDRRLGISRGFIGTIVPASTQDIVSKQRSSLMHGAHWFWRSSTMILTEAGLLQLAERMESQSVDLYQDPKFAQLAADCHVAALSIRAEAEKLQADLKRRAAPSPKQTQARWWDR